MGLTQKVCAAVRPSYAFTDFFLGKIQLATELTVGDREFEHFDIYSVPTTIGFHLREFSVCACSMVA